MNGPGRWLAACLLLALASPGHAVPRRGICAPTYYPGVGVLFTESIASDLELLGCGYLRVPFYDEHGWVNLVAFDEVIDRAEAHGIDVLGVVLLDPADWDRESAGFLEAFIDRCELLAARYADRVDAWELWNEPEQPVVYISPSRFGAVVAAAYDAVKSRDPDAVVMPGGISSTLPYLEDFYASPEVAAYKAAHGRFPFDAVAVHPYSWFGDPRFYLPEYLDVVRAVMTRHGDGNKPVWITEVGWNTAERQADSVGNDARPYCWNDFAQARNISGLYAIADALPGIDAVFYYALYDYALPDSLGWFGLRRYDSTPKPGWFAYRSAALGEPPACQLINGGFESGDVSGWSVYGQMDGVQGGPWFSGIVPRSGARFLGSAVNLAGPGGGKNGGVMQTTAAAPGARCELSAYVWTYQEGGADSDAACRVGIDPTGGVDPGSENVLWSDFVSSPGGWIRVAVEARPLAGSITAYVEFRQQAPVWDITAADDVLLRVIASGGLGGLKRLPQGAPVCCEGIVTVTEPNARSFYLEALDRTAGIKVESDALVSSGDRVVVKGSMATAGCERAIVGESVALVGTGSVSPLVLNGKSVGGGRITGEDGLWVAQPGTVGGLGLNTVGLLVRLCGKVTCVEPSEGLFYLDDGSGRDDGTHSCTGVRVLSDTAVALGDNVAVTGVVSCFENGEGEVCPRIIPCAVDHVSS